MRKNSYTKAVDNINAPERAVEKMLGTVRSFSSKKKTIVMRKVNFKRVIAASLVIVAVTGGVIGFNCFKRNSMDNSFIMTVNAEEISNENPAIVSVLDGYGLSYSENDDNKIGYWLGFSLECVGDNIESVTYSVDKDMFEVVCLKESNPVIQGDLVSDESDTPFIVNYTEEDQQAFEESLEQENSNSLENPYAEEIMNKYERKHYSSVTFAYDNQNPDGCTFGIVGVSDDDVTAHRDELFISGDTSRLYSKNEWLGKLIGNTVHCTVMFKDGTVQTQDIQIGTAISTYGDVFPEEFSELSDDIKDARNYQEVFVTYSLS